MQLIRKSGLRVQLPRLLIAPKRPAVKRSIFQAKKLTHRLPQVGDLFW